MIYVPKKGYDIIRKVYTFTFNQNVFQQRCVMFWMYENKKTRNLEYVLFEGNTKHCNKMMGVLPQNRMSYVCVS